MKSRGALSVKSTTVSSGVVKQHGAVRVVDTNGKGRGLITMEEIRKGKRILKINGALVARREVKNSNAALQIDEDLFLESDGTIDENLNHSCDPNCYVDFDSLCLVALKDIAPGEELTFNYNASEYDLVDQGCAFLCCCGAVNCVRHLRGFKYLSSEQKRRIKPLLSPFLEKKMKMSLSAEQEGSLTDNRPR